MKNNTTSIEIVTPDDLRTIIKEVIIEEVPKLMSPPPVSQPIYYTRKEAAKRTRITLPTLDKYVEAGKIKAFRLGRRVLFTEEDILNALRELPYERFKRRRHAK